MPWVDRELKDLQEVEEDRLEQGELEMEDIQEEKEEVDQQEDERVRRRVRLDY